MSRYNSNTHDCELPPKSQNMGIKASKQLYKYLVYKH